MKLKYLIEKDFHEESLEKFLKNYVKLSKRLLRKLKSQERIYCNGKIHKVFMPIFIGDVVEIDMDFEEYTDFLEPQNIPIQILFENQSVIAVNKNPGIVVHPSANHYNGTIANSLLFHFNKNNLNIKIRPVSRLDRDTSGVILFAKNSMVQESLINQMKEDSFEKEYLGIITGKPHNSIGTIDMPIGRKEGSTIERQICENGVRAVTHYKVLKNLNDVSVVIFRLQTGRTHQIRVHCLGINHPLVGDTLYSPFKTNLIDRQALHARRIVFTDPIDRSRISITAPCPKDILSLIANSKQS